MFGGVNNREAPKLIDKEYFTGVLELTDIKGTIDIVMRIHPDTKKIFFVADRSQIGTSNWNRVESLSSRYPDIHFFRIDDSLSLSEIEDKVKKLSGDSVVLFSMLYRDKTGIIPFEEGISRISKASRRPTYTFHSQYIKYGAIGGKVLDGKHHGGEVAKIAMQILQGERVSNIPVVERPLGQYIFDYAQLKRFGINLSALPKESIILNSPFSFYREYKKLVWITSIFVFILIVIIIVLQINITKRTRAEKELRKYYGRLEEMVKERTRELEVSEEKYRVLYNKSPGMMISVDVSTRKVVECNDTLLKATGFSTEEIIGKKVFDLYHPDSVEAAHKVFNKFLATNEVHGVDLQLFKKNREKIDVLLDVTARVDKKTGKKYTMSIWHDITERKQAEKLLRKANKKLIEIDQLKSMFIASMNHELRTPLNSIIGFTGIILQGIDGEITPQQNDHLGRVNRSAKHLLALINDIIDLSKIEAGKVDIFVGSVVLDEVISEAVNSVRPQIKEKRLVLNVSVPQGVRMNTDSRRLYQCILNFLSNAVKFTETGTISVTAHETDKEVEISVSDTGIGIPKEDQQRLFKPFERIDSHLRTKILGTGLGLYLTKKLATELLEGSVEVQSQYGMGSTFTLRLPKVIEND